MSRISKKVQKMTPYEWRVEMKNYFVNIKTPLDLPCLGESEMVLFVYLPIGNAMFLLEKVHEFS